MKKLKNFLIKNWKTSIAGVIVAIATYLKVANIIDANAFTLIGSLTTAVGLMLAKDSDKSGDTSVMSSDSNEPRTGGGTVPPLQQ